MIRVYNDTILLIYPESKKFINVYVCSTDRLLPRTFLQGNSFYFIFFSEINFVFSIPCMFLTNVLSRKLSFHYSEMVQKSSILVDYDLNSRREESLIDNFIVVCNHTRNNPYPKIFSAFLVSYSSK